MNGETKIPTTRLDSLLSFKSTNNLLNCTTAHHTAILFWTLGLYCVYDMSSYKRKRSTSISSRASLQHLDIINPHSHSENTIKQLNVAGLTDNDILPSTYIPHFPHRPVRPSHLPQSRYSGDDAPSDTDDDDEEEQQEEEEKKKSNAHGTGAASPNARDRARRAKGMRDAQDQHLGLLTNVILRALEEGNISRAKRAFGLVRRSEVRGKPVDLRRKGLWSLGAEVLMRDGEDAVAAAAAPLPPVQRWGASANMPQLRAYLEELVRQYPYNRLHPNSISDVDFYPVLFGCEFYNTWAEHRLALERLERDSEAWSDDIDMADEPYADDYHVDQVHLTGRDRRLRESRADLALHAMVVMQDIAKRMDTLMETAPYRTSVEMLRLRGMVALYVGDLSVPPSPRTDDEEEEGKRARDEERDRAGRHFRKMRDDGGQVDAFTEKWLEGRHGDSSGADEDDDDMEPAWGGLPVFSSLPMRQ